MAKLTLFPNDSNKEPDKQLGQVQIALLAINAWANRIDSDLTTLQNQGVVGADGPIGLTGPAGAQGIPGVISGTYPILYDSGTRVVGIAPYYLPLTGGFLTSNLTVSGNISAVNIYGSHYLNISGVSTNFTPALTDCLINVDTSGGSRIVTLPTAIGNTGKVYNIRKSTSDVNIVIVSGNSSQTFNGDLTKEILYQHSNMQVVSNGTNWWVI